MLYTEKTASWYNIGNCAQEMRVTDKQVFKREEEMKRKPADGPGPKPSPLKKGGPILSKGSTKSTAII